MGQTVNLNIGGEVAEPQKPLGMHPKKFALWLFIVSIIMIFAALTSAYIVRKADGNWLEYKLPFILYVNTFIILLSSISMHWAYICARKNDLNALKGAIVLTTALGIAFLVGQFYGWEKLVEANVYFGGATSNPSGSFLYVLTGLHGIHIICGVVYLIIVLFSTFQYKIHSKNLVQLEMCATFWHFLDFLWIYLFIFLILNS